MVAVVFAFIPQAYAQEYQKITEIGGEPETRLTVKLPVEVPPNVMKDIVISTLKSESVGKLRVISLRWRGSKRLNFIPNYARSLSMVT